MTSIENELAGRLTAEGLLPSSWSNGPDDVYPAHEHAYDKVLVVASGSITFGLPEAEVAFALTEGDRLELPAATVHDAIVGAAGVVCLEAHAPAGRVAGVARREAGTW